MLEGQEAEYRVDALVLLRIVGARQHLPDLVGLGLRCDGVSHARCQHSLVVRNRSLGDLLHGRFTRAGDLFARERRTLRDGAGGAGEIADLRGDLNLRVERADLRAARIGHVHPVDLADEAIQLRDPLLGVARVHRHERSEHAVRRGLILFGELDRRVVIRAGGVVVAQEGRDVTPLLERQRHGRIQLRGARVGGPRTGQLIRCTEVAALRDERPSLRRLERDELVDGRPSFRRIGRLRGHVRVREPEIRRGEARSDGDRTLHRAPRLDFTAHLLLRAGEGEKRPRILRLRRDELSSRRFRPGKVVRERFPRDRDLELLGASGVLGEPGRRAQLRVVLGERRGRIRGAQPGESECGVRRDRLREVLGCFRRVSRLERTLAEHRVHPGGGR
jgi:hypothetical protein